MLVDTNVLVYAVNTLALNHEKARDFLRNEYQHVVIAHQNILESLRVLTHTTFPQPLSLKETLRIADDFSSSFRVISPKDETLPIFHALIQKYSCTSNAVFDAYLVATALTNDVSVIVTDNERHFRIFEEITVFNPFTQPSN